MKAYSYIRFSTPEQEKGDSLRRQVEQSEAYCQEHGLTLDDSLRLTDRGLSAFHGVHRIKGALGEFHRLVDQGEIEPGSVLLVESLDRLSREQVLDALTQFTGLIQAGVKVVTLADHMEYDRDRINTNFGQLLMSLVIMSRAHEESKIKSFRGKHSWEKKRRDALNGDKLTAQCPAWLKLSEDKRAFEVLPEVAEAVNRIFRMKLEGKGSESIARILNAEQGIWKPNGKRNPTGGWRKSYINKILRNRAVIGEFTPHRKIEKIRVPLDPIPGYYPAIVDEELFNRVQSTIHRNREMSGNAGGRTGMLSNLFGYLAKCAHCGGPMAYINKGQPTKKRKGGQYLECDRARRGLGCKKKSIPYSWFENLVLNYCKGLDLGEILPGDDKRQSELARLRNQLQGTEGALAQTERKVANLLDSLEDADSPEFVKPIKDRIKALQGRKTELEEQREDLNRQIVQKIRLAQDAEQQLTNIRDLILKMHDLSGQARIDLRLKLRNELRRLISQINVFPDIKQVGILFKTGERRLIIEGRHRVPPRILDVLPGARRVPAQLWMRPWENPLTKKPFENN